MLEQKCEIANKGIYKDATVKRDNVKAKVRRCEDKEAILLLFEGERVIVLLLRRRIFTLSLLRNFALSHLRPKDESAKVEVALSEHYA